MKQLIIIGLSLFLWFMLISAGYGWYCYYHRNTTIAQIVTTYDVPVHDGFERAMVDHDDR